MVHNVFAVTMPNMNPDRAVPIEVLLIDSVYASLNFSPRLDTAENLPLCLLVAAPHQTRITHYRVGLDIILGLEKFIEFVSLSKNLSIWAVNTFNRRFIPPIWEEWSWEGKLVDLVIANKRDTCDILDWFKKHRKGVCEGLIKVAGPAPVNG